MRSIRTHYRIQRFVTNLTYLLNRLPPKTIDCMLRHATVRQLMYFELCSAEVGKRAIGAGADADAAIHHGYDNLWSRIVRICTLQTRVIRVDLSQLPCYRKRFTICTSYYCSMCCSGCNAIIMTIFRCYSTTRNGSTDSEVQHQQFCLQIHICQILGR